jgi:hypothetical protein
VRFARPWLIARAYGATASIGFSIPSRPGGLAMRNVHPGLLPEGRMHSQTMGSSNDIRAAVIDDLSLTAACADLTGCPQHHE